MPKSIHVLAFVLIMNHDLRVLTQNITIVQVVYDVRIIVFLARI